jgi:hypothetical protein
MAPVIRHGRTHRDRDDQASRVPVSPRHGRELHLPLMAPARMDMAEAPTSMARR